MYPHTLNVMVNAMESYPDAALGVTSSSKSFTKGVFFKHNPKSAYSCHFFKRNLLNHGPSGVIIKREVFFSLNGFSGKRNVSDFEMWLKMAANYPVIEMEHDLVYWREHEGQEINVASYIYVELLYQVLRKALENPSCPLNENEKQYLLSNQKKITLVNILKEAVKRKNLRYFFSTLKLNRLNILHYFALPVYFLNTSNKLPWNRKWHNQYLAY